MAEGQLILIVDDEAPFREIARTILEAGGFRVMEAEDGEDGLKKAIQFKPRLILLDMKMPKLTGAETLAAFREKEELRAMPVIFLTNFGDPRAEFAEADRHFSEQMGAQDYISKAKLTEELIPRITAALGK